ncbi:MAG: hypothetical protein KA791_02535 [Flavobacteriales bacterium]|nr:hypothetical protein [Flavobacteriales bacterium]
MNLTPHRLAFLMVIAFGVQLGCVAQVLFDRTTGDAFQGDTDVDEIDSIALIDPMVVVLNADGSRDSSVTDSTKKILLAALKDVIPEQITIAAFQTSADRQHDLNNAVYHLMDGLADGKTSQVAQIIADLSDILERERVRFALGILHFGRSVPRSQDQWSEMRCVIVDSQNRDVALFVWSHVYGHSPSEERVLRYQLSRAFKKYFKGLKGKR